MSKYYYTKSTKRFRLSLFGKKFYIKLSGLLLIAIGLFGGGYFFFPIISYQLFISPVFASAEIEVPIPKSLVTRQNNLEGLVAQGIQSLTRDYTDARNWYPTIETVERDELIPEYHLTIPKLGIENAVVSTIDYDLSEHLVHYGGTSNPGTNGTAVIFGHSTLPQLFDPTDYKAIFATLHNLETNDEILITIKNTTYKYKIYSINITSPDDLNMFSQSYDNSYITLVTCTPPGTVWKRLVIRASLDGLGVIEKTDG